LTDIEEKLLENSFKDKKYATGFTPRINEKRWNPKREISIFENWQKEDIYKFNKDSGKPIFSIDTPPPYASGKWHVGAATHYAQIDMVARYRRMTGWEVLFPFGVDRNGLPVEVEVEKAQKISAHEIPREKFLELCKNFLDRVENDIIAIAKRMGLSCNLKNFYRTDSSEYRRITQDTFIELWNRGLIYEDNRPTNWCTVCQTSIADAEIEYSNIETKLCYIRFKVKEGGEIVIATTRPELICSCRAVIFNPEDERYKHLEGQHAVTPFFETEVPIIASGYAKPEFGTGIVMICSFGDYTDIRLFRELNLEPKIAITKEGRMNEVAGPYKGLKIAEARKRIISDLKEKGLLVKEENIKHSIPICWRSKNQIEFIAMNEYYLKQLPYIDKLKTIIDRMIFHPPESKQLLLNWINSINVDWPISRRRFYGTEIPLWYCKKCGDTYVPKPGKYYQPWKEKPPTEKCKCGSTEFVGETRTFDTWMDSSISQLYVIGYKWDEDLFKKTFPCSLRPQGQDIVRTWLYYSLLRTYHLFSSPPFRDVRISGMGLDAKGEAMHKSRGNIIQPEPILERFGADAFRFWGAAEAKLGSNYRFSAERLEGSFKFITKLWNVARFISSFPLDYEGFELEPLDRMILAELNSVIKESLSGYEETDFFVPAQAIRKYVWNIFADHYVEAVKARAYNFDKKFTIKQQKAAWYTLHTNIQIILKLLAPICPFVTEAIWLDTYSSRTIHKEKMPKANPDWDTNLRENMQKFIEFNSNIWKLKKEKNIALNEKVSIVYAPKELEPFAKDLKAMHKIQEIHFKEPPEDVKRKADKITETYVII
jgi:valyl-tRNA synthetase